MARIEGQSFAKQNALAAATLALGITILFLHPADQYFFGDSVSTLETRSQTWRAALHDFVRLGGSHWYRPFDGFLPSLAWSLFGMNFAAYHALAMLLHFGLCFGLYLALKAYVKDAFAAWVGAACYAFHPIQFYATYDACFYQEPQAAALILGALASLYAYVLHGSKRWLAAGTVLFLLSVTSRELAVFTPALLLIVMWPPANLRRGAIAVGISGTIGAAFVAAYVWIIHPIRYQPQVYASDWSPVHMAGNLWTGIRWAFALAAGVGTEGWKAPAIVQACLWMAMIVAIAGIALFAKRQPAVWKGPVFFGISMTAALLTHVLRPHHLYVPLMGIALCIAGIFSCLRQPATGWRLARPAATVLLSCVFVTAAISARYDSVVSWVGAGSWETRLPALYSQALFRDLPQWRGVWIVVKTGEPTWSWLYGHLFSVMAGDAEAQVEGRLMSTRPAAAPRGIHVFEYRDSILYALAIPESTVSSVPVSDLRVTPDRVHPGTSYTVTAPALAGRTIDLRYSYNDHLPAFAYEFAHLDANGSAQVFTPRDTPWGVVEISGVRPSGAAEWSPVNVRVEVLRD